MEQDHIRILELEKENRSLKQSIKRKEVTPYPDEESARQHSNGQSPHKDDTIVKKLEEKHNMEITQLKEDHEAQLIQFQELINDLKQAKEKQPASVKQPSTVKGLTQQISELKVCLLLKFNRYILCHQSAHLKQIREKDTIIKNLEKKLEQQQQRIKQADDSGKIKEQIKTLQDGKKN